MLNFGVLVLFIFFVELAYSFPTNQTTIFKSKSTSYTFRLHPGNNMVEQLLSIQKEYQLKAMNLVTCCGSFTDISIRFANQKELTHLQGHFEAVSCSGTIGSDGKKHIHISVGDENGKTISGHLGEGKIYTTLETTIMELDDVIYERRIDPETTFDELYITERNKV